MDSHSEETKRRISNTLKQKAIEKNKFLSFDQLSRSKRREFLLSEAEYKCTLCGYDERRQDGGCILEIDHIDGNHLNNTRTNLRVLCPNCHAKTSNFRNWGRKRSVKTSTRVR